MKLTISLTVVALFASTYLYAQSASFEQAVKKIDARFEPAEAKPGQTVQFKLTVELNPGWYTYPTVQPNKEVISSVNRIILPLPGEVVFVESVKNPPFQTENDPVLGPKDFYPGGTTWDFPVVVSPDATPGFKEIMLKQFRILLCVKRKNAMGKPEELCLPPRTVAVKATLTVLGGPPEPIERRYLSAFVTKAIAGFLTGNTIPMSFEPKQDIEEEKKTAVSNLILKNRDYALDMAAVEAMLPKYETDNAGFVTFVFTAMFWGLVTLLTPCVFPMVPITVSFFLKQGEKKQHNPLTMAFVYTLTIILVLGVAALFFLSFFRQLSVDPWMNAALGLLFVVFALSLFGMFDIVLPSFLVRFTSSREGKGGYGGVIFMALSFSIVSFTCVAPFLGGFAGMVSSGKFSNVQLAAGALAFSGTFAAPFFLLAIFPSLLKKIPKSGSWMNTIKVVMGFLELAAALKFFRTAELRWLTPPTIFTYDFVLSMYVVILIFAGLYLLSLYRLPHDEPQEHIGVTRMLTGLLCMSIALYLTPGLFANGSHEKQRPSGTIYAWIDAFLLPEPSGAEVVGGGELTWSGDLRQVIEASRASGETVFIDFTGVTCTNCKLNEKNVFPIPGVSALLKQFRLVQLYTDEVPAVFYESAPSKAQREQDAVDVNLKFQKDVFGTEQLPLYVLLRPQPGTKGGPVQIVGVYDEGKINNISKFEEFLKKGLERSPK